MKHNYKTVSLAKFISRYEFFKGKDLKKLTHKDVMHLFPNLVRASFELIEKNPCLVYEDKIVLVDDGRSVIPYVVPEVLEACDEYVDFNYENAEKEREPEFYDFYSMDASELKRVLYEKFTTCKQKHLAKRELVNRGIVRKRKYKRCTEKKWKFEDE